jgi:hypothetical protein
MKAPESSVGKIIEHSVPNNAPTKPSLSHSASVTRNGSDGLGSRGPITVNGVHPITHRKPMVQKHGAPVHAAPAKKPSQELIKEQGAVTDNKLGDGKHIHEGKHVEKMAAANAKAGESKTSGSTAEEQKTAAQIMYPKKIGLRGKVMDG